MIMFSKLWYLLDCLYYRLHKHYKPLIELNIHIRWSCYSISIFVKLNIADQPYKFTKQLKSKTVTENHKVTLDCEVDDAAAPVTWYLGDKLIEADKT